MVQVELVMPRVADLPGLPRAGAQCDNWSAGSIGRIDRRRGVDTRIQHQLLHFRAVGGCGEEVVIQITVHLNVVMIRASGVTENVKHPKHPLSTQISHRA